MSHLLDNPVWHALQGPHRRHAIGHGLAAHYPREMAVFSALAEPTQNAFTNLASGIAAGSEARLVTQEAIRLPPDWQQVNHMSLLQMLGTHCDGQIHDGPPITELGAKDVDAVLALIDLTQPGPFGSRTLEMGRYLGIYDNGELLAMAGERMNLPGFIEMSAICTHPTARGRGLAEYLMRPLLQAALARGQTPFLHVLPHNEPAIALYQRLGFTPRATMNYLWCKPTDHSGAAP